LAGAAPQGPAAPGPAPGHLLDRLVQIRGLEGPVVPRIVDEGPQSSEPVQANNLVGLAVHWLQDIRKYVVCTFELVHLDIAEEHLVLYEPPPAAEGGFDVRWPYQRTAFFDFCASVNNALLAKNWCVIQAFKSPQAREEALAAAKRRDYGVPKEELLPDLLGRRGQGKVSHINPLFLIGAEEAMLERPPASDLEAYDQDITKLFGMMGPMTWDSMGFQSFGRTESMAWQPFSSSREQTALTPEPLNDDDIEQDQVLERHIQFLRRRKLGFLYMVDNEGGKLTLHPRADLKMEPVTIPLQRGRLLVFRSDLMTFQFQPNGHHLTLLAWVLEPAPKIELGDIIAKSEAYTEVLNIKEGPLVPQGQRAHIMSGCCMTGGDVLSLEDAAMMYQAATDAHIFVPYSRFDTDIYFTKDGDNDLRPYENSYHHHGGLVNDKNAMCFDYSFFGLDNFEAQLMAPAHQKVLEVGYETLFRGGWSKATLKGQKILMYVGDSGSDWWLNVVTRQMYGQHCGSPGDSRWEAARHQHITGSRLSYCLDMKGECWICDTACSSGLTAFCTAMYSIKIPNDKNTRSLAMDCHCQGALAGGTNMISDPNVYVGACGQHMLSLKGRCFTFNGTGDGYARGEGTSMCYVKISNSDRDTELQEAAAIGNKVNQDGRSASMTAPNGPSQQMCIKASLREAGVMPREITASECHGTGTSLGDPIEVGSLRGVQETDERDSPVLLSSSKSNIGHLEANAGTTGLFKCILMSKYGGGLPNCHLYQLNPHLDVSGWPTWMVSEVADYQQQSGLVGVSSFGVSGTNSHCEVWALTVVGPNSAGRKKLNYEALKQITVTCPVTLGPIDYLTGEPARNDGKKALAESLREELQPYDISSAAYEGSYRYRRDPLDDDDLVNAPGVKVTIHGSWSGWMQFEQMKEEEDGAYAFTIKLGHTRCESFFICLDGVADYRFYPACHAAGPQIFVHGPDPGGEEAERNRWLIDGRDDGQPAGTAYKIKFYWGTNRKRVEWQEVPGESEEATEVPTYEHRYSLIGTWTGGKTDQMTSISEDGCIWEYKARIGNLGEELFQLCRDSDEQQLIYPAVNGATSGDVPVRGPDDLGDGKMWLVTGPVDQLVTIRLEVSDGQVLVSVATSSQGEKVWESQEGWERHTYWLNFQNGPCIQMSMDPEVPGLFRARYQMGRHFDEQYRGICEFFTVIVDGDPNFGFFPDFACASSGECIVWGPDRVPLERPFLVKSWQAGAGFEVALDARARDRRKMVTWSWDTPPRFVFSGGAGLVA